MRHRRSGIGLAIGWLLLAPAASVGAGDADLRALRAELEQMRADYERRIAALEARVSAGETASASVQVGASPNAFNPSIGLVLDGKYRAFSRSPADPGIPGFPLGEEAGPGDEGFSLGESELQLDASVDDRFRGSATIALADEGGETVVELENAFVQTSALGRGLTLKAGRFFSGIGYLNEHHSHTDDFTDRPLLYRAFLDTQLGDDGVQLRWLAPTDLFVELGGELLRGASFPAGGNESSGKGAWSLFGRAGGDVGTGHSWSAGVSFLVTDARDRDSGEGDLFSGDTRMWLADVVWKWAPDGNAYRNSLSLQGGIARLDEDGLFTPQGGTPLSLSTDRYGWYAQGVYQLLPGLRGGVRYDELHADRLGTGFDGTALDRMGHTPRQLSIMADWAHSEFSRVRLQFSLDRSAPRSNSRFIAQYVMSLGAHGAHRF